MKKVYNILTNKFLLTGIAFAVWMFYFDQNDLLLQWHRKQELKADKATVAYLQTEISNMEKENKAMRTDPEELEKYAREHYRMKKDNEDLYIIEKK